MLPGPGTAMPLSQEIAEQLNIINAGVKPGVKNEYDPEGFEHC